MPPATPSSGHRHREPAFRIAAIAAGGTLGTLARYGVSRALVPAPGGFPWRTFLVNMAGSFALGMIVTLVTERWPPTRYVRPFAAIGFCGGFTTFSTFTVEVAQRAQRGAVGLAAAYLVASLLVGLLAVALGVTVARLGSGGGRQAGAIPDPDSLTTLADSSGSQASLTSDERTER